MMARFLPSFVVSALLATTSARAADKTACLDAASTAQRLRAEHMLVEARDQLRVCAAAACPAVVQSDCAEWLEEVEKALPSVVVTATTRRGADRVDVKVTVDGKPFLDRLDGRAIAMNAGPHVFHFEAADGARADLQVVIREGQQSQSVATVLDEPSGRPATEPFPRPRVESGSTPWRMLAWAFGGAGVLGLGVGAAAGLVAIADKGSAQCNASHQCQPGPLSRARSAALASDIGFIAGGVLLASSIVLVLVSPPATARPGGASTGGAGANLQAAAVVGPGAGGVIVSGRW
jgi:hypothetical protein